MKLENYINIINTDNFDTLVLELSETKPILVDFWAQWCSPCIIISPMLEQIINHYQGKIILAKIEVDDGENMKIAGKYQIRGFPSVLLFSNRSEIDRFSGAQNKQFIIEFIEKNIIIN